MLRNLVILLGLWFLRGSHFKHLPERFFPPLNAGKMEPIPRETDLREERSAANENLVRYAKLIVRSTIYYTTSLIVIVGWVFIYLNDLLSVSNTFQLAELFRNYPNISFPFLGILVVNVTYLGVLVSLWHLLDHAHSSVTRLIGLSQYSGFLSNSKKIVLIPCFLATILPPLTIALLMLIKMPYWIAELNRSLFNWVFVIYVLLLVMYLIEFVFLIFAVKRIVFPVKGDRYYGQHE